MQDERMTAEELRAHELAHEEHIRNLLEVRNRGKRTHWWEQSGLTAIAGTIAGAVLTTVGGMLQKSQELGAENRAAELRQMRSEILAANSAIAKMLRANEVRFRLATGQLRNLPDPEKDKMRLETNDWQREWRREREDAEMAVRLSFAPTPEVPAAWSQARERVEVYTECMEREYEKHQRGIAPDTVCNAEREGSLKSMNDFRSALVSAYTMAQRR
jgi:hypothetical protein